MALLDRSGARLVVPTIVAGTPVEESVLREASREVLLAQASAGSRRFASSPLAPGEVRAFEALMLEDRLPDTAARVQLELGDPGRAPVASAAPVAAPAIAPAATPVAGAAAAIAEPQLGAYDSTR